MRYNDKFCWFIILKINNWFGWANFRILLNTTESELVISNIIKNTNKGRNFCIYNIHDNVGKLTKSPIHNTLPGTLFFINRFS